VEFPEVHLYALTEATKYLYMGEQVSIPNFTGKNP